ncbi:MAG TPA: head decoration protein [Polyangiaceae bacterium]|nr:head decoration protein [Polyangiaceae bacterium]
MTNTELDVGTVQIRDCEFKDELINFSGADDLKEGTILARDSSTLKLRLFVKGGSTNGNGIPKAVLAHRLVVTASGDKACRVIIRGEVVKERLVIDADGDDSNIDGAVLDQLRDYGITPVATKQLARVDNPQPEPEGS